MRQHALAAALLLLAASAASAASAAQPRLLHANVTTVAASGDLGAQVRRASTAWVGYAVPAIDGTRVMCCFESSGSYRSGGGCSLGDDSSSFTNVDRDDIHVAATTVSIFVHVAGGVVDKVRSFSPDCALDASGNAVTWIEGADPRGSIAFLSSLITGANGDTRLSRRALSAVAMHADNDAGDRLERWARSGGSDELRGEAVFWLGETRPQRGYEVARALLRDGATSRRLGEKAVFVLSQIGTPQAVDEMIRVARESADAHTRGQALFWLSQKAGKKAAAAIRDAVDNDPDEHTRERAVFAVSQMPDDQSIPMLIDLLEHHRSPAVRKKAAFWLGQKKDPRALQAIEDILRR
jgi:hypothetical protein